MMMHTDFLKELKREFYRNQEMYSAVAKSIKQSDPDLSSIEVRKSIDTRATNLIKQLRIAFQRHKLKENRILDHDGEISTIADESQTNNMKEILPSSAALDDLLRTGGSFLMQSVNEEEDAALDLSPNIGKIMDQDNDYQKTNEETNDYHYHDYEEYYEQEDQKTGEGLCSELSREINFNVQYVVSGGR